MVAEDDRHESHAAGDGRPRGPATTIVACVQLDANVDDLDPRLWPDVIRLLLDAGAHDAWITPIVMKKGRPAVTLSVLGDESAADELRRIVFAETSTLGLRETAILKHELARSFDEVVIDGHRIAVKIAHGTDGDIVNRSVEWSDVVAAADALGQPIDQVRARAEAAAWTEEAT
ncbi:MAG: nickel insertion protein [Actinomycetota bacterium]